MTETDEETWQALARRLDAIGGALLDGPESRWGSRQILTPAGHYDKLLWVTPDALAELLNEWEAAPERYGPRLAVWMARITQGGTDASDR